MPRPRVVASPLRALLASAAVLLCAAGCTPRAEIELQAERPTATLSEEVLACSVDASAEPGCVATLAYAVERSDRASVGQILLGRATALDGAARRALVRAALWLNNSPWVPEANIALVDDIAAVEVPVFAQTPGALFFFEDAQGPAPEAGSVLADTPMTRVDLPIPDGAGPLVGDELVATLTAAAGGLAAAWQPSRQAPVRVVPATPLFTRLLGMQVAGVPGAWDAMILAGRADTLARSGAHMDAWTQLGRALDALPADAPPCSTRGALLLARYTIGNKARVDDLDDLITELDEVCLWPTDPDAVSLSETETLTRDYLRELTFMTTLTRPPHAPAMTAAALRVPDQLAQWHGEVEALADRLDGRRAALLRLLAEQQDVGLSTARDVCDVDFEARKRATQLELRARLDQLGRVDLATALNADIVDLEGHIDRQAVQTVVAAANQPHNRWRRAAMLVAMLQSAQNARWLTTDRGALRAACRTTIDAVQAQVATDHYEGASGRNVERLFAVYGLQRACSSATEVADLLDAVLEAALEEGGADAVLSVIGHAGGQLALSLVQPSGYDWVRVLSELTAGLGRVRSALGDAPDEQLMGATLDVTIELSNALAGTATLSDISRALRTVAEAAAPLAAAPVGEDASTVAKLAPAFRLTALGGMAAIAAAEGDMLAMQAHLDDLEATLDADVRTLLANYDAAEHADAVERLLRATRSLVTAFTVSTPDTVRAARQDIEAALQPGPQETGWWALGLDVTRVALLDVWAMTLATDHLGDDEVAEALERASQLLDRTVGTGIETFDVAATTWELTRVLPVAHRGLTEAFTLDAEFDTVLADVLPDFEPPLAIAVAAMGDLTHDPQLRGGLIDVFVLMARAADGAGLGALGQGDPAAIETFVARSLAALEPLPPEVRGYSRTMVASTLFVVDRDRASAQFALAEQELEASWLDKVAYLPRVVEATLYLRLGDDVERSLAIAQDVIERWGDPALACDQSHVVHSLLPFVAWAHESLGNHEEAELAMERWQELLESDPDFRGDGVLTCQLSSQRGGFVANLNVSQTLSSLLLRRPTNEGTFQVGVGFSSLERTEETLTCGGTPLPGVRPDIVATAELSAAVWALRAGDHDRATRWLMGGLGQLSQVTFGSAMTLGAAANTLAQAREGFGDTPRWAIAAAALDGHFWTARHLDFMMRPLMVMPETSTDDGSDALAPPSMLEQIELGDHLPPVVELVAWAPYETPEQLAVRYEAARRTIPDDMAVDLAVLYSGLLSQSGAEPEVVAAPLEGLDVGDDPVERAVLESWRTMLEVERGELPALAEVEALVDTWLAADRPAEAAMFADMVMLGAMIAGDNPLLFGVADLIWDRVPCDALGAACATISAQLTRVWQQAGDWEKLSIAIERALAAGPGILEPGQELQLRQTQLALLAASGRVRPLRDALAVLVPMYITMAPDDPATTNLLLLDLMVDIAVEGVDDRQPLVAERLDVLLEKLDAAGLSQPPTTKFFGQLRANLDEPEQARELAVRYVRWALLGEPL